VRDVNYEYPDDGVFLFIVLEVMLQKTERTDAGVLF
jgi:hypothetical protein